MIKLLVALAVIAILVLGFLAFQAYQSRAAEPPGLFDGQLRPCPDSPNCVCSEFPADAAHYVAPIDFEPPAEETMSRLKTIIADLGGDIEIDYGNYVAAVFNSDLFGFADDFELRVDSEGRRIHIRSSARVGYSDFGVNRKRVERIRKRLRDET